MKYFPLLFFLAGCESFPDKREPQLIEVMEGINAEETPREGSWADDLIEDGIKVEPKKSND
tara:strand:+ start:397 stop:579 length:183 start_codon:yes stop_codon:yes gene_type:complete